jgi:hypothetical protein
MKPAPLALPGSVVVTKAALIAAGISKPHVYRVFRLLGIDGDAIDMTLLPPRIGERYRRHLLRQERDQGPRNFERVIDAYAARGLAEEARAEVAAREKLILDSLALPVREIDGSPTEALSAIFRMWPCSVRGHRGLANLGKDGSLLDRPLTLPTYYRKLKERAQHGAIALIPKLDKTVALNDGRRRPMPAHVDAFLRRFFLERGGIKMKGRSQSDAGALRTEALRAYEDEAAKRGWSFELNYARVSRFYRALNSHAWAFVEGPDAVAKTSSWVPRDKSEIQVGELLVGDAHKIDAWLRGPDGIARRYWLVAWLDYRSFAIWGYVIVEAPNSMAIAMALWHAITRKSHADYRNAFGIPSDIQIDNGKDYTSRHLLGGRQEKREKWDLYGELDSFGGVFSQLGIRVHRAIAYNARSKTIERKFRVLTRIAAALPGYTGSSPAGRPERVERELAMHEAWLAKKPNVESPLMTLDEFRVRFAEELHKIDSLESRSVSQGARKFSPLEYVACYGGQRREPAREEAISFLPRHTRIVRANGVQFGPHWYWHEELLSKFGEEVEVRELPHDSSQIFLRLGANVFPATRVETGAFLNPGKTEVAIRAARLRERKRRDVASAALGGSLARPIVGRVAAEPPAEPLPLATEAFPLTGRAIASKRVEPIDEELYEDLETGEQVTFEELETRQRERRLGPTIARPKKD